jgi:glycosyltransferase involved in cell wall biosynthesis
LSPAPRHHPLRSLRPLVDDLLEDDEDVGPIVRALLLQALFSIPNDAVLCERIRNDRLFSWFVGLKRPGAWTPRSIRLSRARLFEAGIAPLVFLRLFASPRGARLLFDRRLRVDLVQLEAWNRHAAMSPEEQPLELGSILRLPRMSDSSPSFPFLEADGTTTPLERVLRHLTAAVSGPLAVTACTPATAVVLEPVVRRCGARVLTLAPCTQLTQLLEVASQLNVASLAVWELDAALLPAPFIRALCRHHARTGNDLTVVKELPEGVGGQIYRTACLQRMRAETPRYLNVSPSEWFEWVGDNAGTAKPIRFHSAGLRHPPRANQARPERAGTPERTFTRAIAPKTGRGPRILYVTPSRAFSGPERMVARVAGGLLDRGVDLWGLLVRPGLIGRLLREEHRGRFIADDVEFDQPTQASFAYCMQVMRDLRPDVVHCNGIPDWPVMAAAQVVGVPVVEHVRVAEFAADEDSFAAAARLIAVSNFVREELLAVGVDAARVLVSHDGLDETFFHRDDRGGRRVRRQFGVEDGDVVVLCVARCCRSKRIETVIHALAAAKPKRRAAHLLIVGEPEDPTCFESQRDLLARYGMQATTHYLSAVEDMRAMYAAADVLMLASVRDPLPNAVLEAMASRTPVIAAASGGIPEMIDDRTGTLVDADSVAGFARALRQVFDGSPEVQRKARRARAVARRRFNLVDHVDAIRRVYDEVVAGSRQHGPTASIRSRT